MESSTFSLDDYDSIGLDLDCTLAEYNVKELIKLIYHSLVDFLIKNKSYESEYLQRSFEDEDYFLQKGLVMDFKRGNVLKMGGNGEILKATHGTKPLSDGEIVKQYGPDRTLSMFQEFINNPILMMNTENENVLRATLDCFDLATVLIFARTVDHLDSKSEEIPIEYSVWPDILEGLYHIYNRQHFSTGESEFFLALRNNPSLYYKKWTPEKVAWLKDLKSKKFVFLLTGSFIDFASQTAGYCIGENWKDYFHIVLCYARKPSFFFSKRHFLKVQNSNEEERLGGEGLQINSVYSHGNWEVLKALISAQTNAKEPKCLYIGDNLIHDVCAPVHFKCCHSVAVSVELKDEFKSTSLWGSYFGETNEGTSFWNRLIKNHAMICISGLDVFLDKPLNFCYPSLKSGQTNELNELNGYHAG